MSSGSEKNPMNSKVGSRLTSSDVALIKVVDFCIINNVKLVRSKFDIHRYGFLGRARRARSPAS